MGHHVGYPTVFVNRKLQSLLYSFCYTLYEPFYEMLAYFQKNLRETASIILPQRVQRTHRRNQIVNSKWDTTWGIPLWS